MFRAMKRTHRYQSRKMTEESGATSQVVGRDTTLVTRGKNLITRVRWRRAIWLV